MKQISLICFRVYLEVYVVKNPTCFSRWSVRLLGDLIKEIRDVKTRLTKLVKFKESGEFYNLSEENQELLNEQYESMVKYLGTLEKRFNLNKQLNKQLKDYLVLFVV